jgi:hypothetical protein
MNLLPDLLSDKQWEAMQEEKLFNLVQIRNYNVCTTCKRLLPTTKREDLYSEIKESVKTLYPDLSIKKIKRIIWDVQIKKLYKLNLKQKGKSNE